MANDKYIKWTHVRWLLTIVAACICNTYIANASYLYQSKYADSLQYVSNDNDYNLVLAAMKGDERVVDDLLQKGMSPDVVLEDGTTPLIWAAQTGQIKICRILIMKGADVNLLPVNSRSPLVSAIKGNQLNIVNYLLENGANIDLPDGFGRTPLMFASANPDSTICLRLIQGKAKIDLKDNLGRDALFAAIVHKQLLNAGILINSGANINTADNDGITPLMLLTINKNIEQIDFMLKKGADINLVSKHGQSSLSIAIESNDEDYIEKIISRGANVNQKLSFATTPLTIAKYTKANKFIIEFLNSENAKSNYLPDFRQFMIGADLFFNTTDFMAGMSVGVKEIKYNVDISSGFAFRPFPVSVLVDNSNNNFSQYWEQRYMAFLGVSKNIDIIQIQNHFKFGANIGLNGIYTYGSYKGTTMYAPNEFVYAPEIGIYQNNGAMQFNLKYQYTNFGYEGVSASKICFSIKILIGNSYRFNENDYMPWE
jgi:ankyrin repeat protein